MSFNLSLAMQGSASRYPLFAPPFRNAKVTRVQVLGCSVLIRSVRLMGKQLYLPLSVTMPSTASPEGVTSVALLRSILDASKTSREPALALVIYNKQINENIKSCSLCSEG